MLYTIACVIGSVWGLGIIPAFFLFSRGAWKQPPAEAGWPVIVFFAVIWPIYVIGDKVVHKMLGY